MGAKGTAQSRPCLRGGSYGTARPQPEAGGGYWGWGVRGKGYLHGYTRLMPSWLTLTWRRRLGAEQKERSHRRQGNFFTDWESKGRSSEPARDPRLPATATAARLTLPCSFFM